ncbi:MAG: hypothetical protein IJD41_05300 [Alphaproteobacteria bacterium]|nr:hypothetical protein [Alphaproteobacteria bacterium]MBQ7127823.1 hypothetical protein [Alphaproteobacteria bacterium]
MKKILLSGFLFATLISGPVMAYKKCVALGGSTTCSGAREQYGQADWAISCTTNGISVPIEGIGMCSANVGATVYATRTSLKTVDSNTNTNNKYCWCKMTYPALSQWVYVTYTDMTPARCPRNCSYVCEWAAQNSAAFLTALFNSLN